MRLRTVLCSLCLALPASSCINGSYYRIRREQPVPEAQATTLLQDRAELQTCLDQLGAPHQVYELPQGMAMAYAWLDKAYWQIVVQIGYTNTAADGQRLFSYSSDDLGYEGLVLIFDADLRLVSTRRGRLFDITQNLRRPPANID